MLERCATSSEMSFAPLIILAISWPNSGSVAGSLLPTITMAGAVMVGVDLLKSMSRTASQQPRKPSSLVATNIFTTLATGPAERSRNSLVNQRSISGPQSFSRPLSLLMVGGWAAVLGVDDRHSASSLVSLSVSRAMLVDGETIRSGWLFAIAVHGGLRFRVGPRQHIHECTGSVVLRRRRRRRRTGN